MPRTKATSDTLWLTALPSDSANLGPELRLLLAAIEQQAGANINLATAQELDWDRTCAAAAHHGLIPLLHHLVEARPEIRPPGAKRAFLAAGAQAGLRRHLLLQAELNRLLELFTEAGIDVIPYKGPALAADLYDLPELRPCGDLDFLILPEQLKPVELLLRRQGYCPSYEFTPAQWPLVLKNEEEIVLSRPLGIHVELHWRLAPRQFALRADAGASWDLRAAWQRSALGEFCGRQARSLAPEDLLLALVIHGSKHAWERLIWLCDLALLLRRYPALDGGRVIANARRAGVERMFGIALALVQALAPVAMPAEVETLSRQAAAGKTVGTYLEWLRGGLAPGGAYEMPAARRHLLILRSRDRLRQRWLYLWRLATLPTAEEMCFIRLPRPLHPFYAGIRAGNLVLRLFRENPNTVLRVTSAAAFSAGRPG